MLVARWGGDLREVPFGVHVVRVMPVELAGAGDLAPVLRAGFSASARLAALRGAVLLVDATLADRSELAHGPRWVHAFATWALAGVLDLCLPVTEPPRV